MASKVVLSRHGRVAHLVLNRPEKLNAIDADCLSAIREHIAEVEADEGIRALVVRGEGRAFCAGADLEAVDALAGDPAEFASFMEEWHATYDAIEAIGTPTVAAVHGLALAGGFELLQVCDIAVLADDARIGDQHARYGLFPGGGSTQRLPRLIGERRAKWLLLSGEWITPEAAAASGLVNEVVPADRVVERAHEMAECLASRSPLLSAAVKRSIRLGLRTDLATALALERPVALAHMRSQDASIGLAAFRSRTTPEFVGR